MARGSDKAAAAALASLLILLGAGSARAGAEPNGFDLTDTRVPAREILRGGPPRDGIPALDAPAMDPAREATWPDSTMVVGIEALRGDGTVEARAYPLSVLVWHELVNDTIAGQPILVSYCPLCGSAMVFERPASAYGNDRFGVSGLLYRSDMLMFDRATSSLWTQIGGRAVTGERAGEQLTLLRSSHERFDAWRARHPETLVLSERTGHRRDYGRTPYGDYATSRALFFPVPAPVPAPQDDRAHPKMRTLGLRTQDGTHARAYPLRLFESDPSPVVDRFGGHAVRIAFSRERDAFVVDAPPEIDVIETYWFAWMAFHPDSTVHRRRAPVESAP